MNTRVAINGFGRIGRNTLRAIIESGLTDIEAAILQYLRWTKRKLWMAGWFASSPGMTTNGASPASCQTQQLQWEH